MAIKGDMLKTSTPMDVTPLPIIAFVRLQH